MKNGFELYDDNLAELNKKNSLSDKLAFLHSVIKKRIKSIDRISVIIYDPKSDLLKTFIYSSKEDHPLVRYQAKLTHVKSLKDIVRNGQARVVNDLTIFKWSPAEHSRRMVSEGFGSSYTLPIYLNDLFLGFTFFNSYQKSSFRPEVLNDLNLFGHLISSLITTELVTIRMMVATVQAARLISGYRDSETGLHVTRVSHYARLISQELAPKFEFNDEFIEHLFLFSPLHDIGKVGLPDSVLKKVEKLTKKEFEEMKNHVVIGGEIIDSIIKDFGLDTLQHIAMLKNMAKFHHEAVDGSGYLFGLKGEEIPIEARIIAVADIFDALTSHRSYKVAWSNDEAFKLLKQLSGIKLDKDCVDALLTNQEKVLEIQEQFKINLLESRLSGVKPESEKKKIPRDGIL